MSYTIFEKEYPSKSTSPTITISPLGRCSLNRAAAEMLSKDAVNDVLLLSDMGAKKVAIRPVVKQEARSYPIRYSKKDNKVVVGAAFSGVMFLKHIGYDYSTTGTYPIVRNSDGSLYEIQLPEDRFGGSEQQQPLVAVEGGKRHAKAG